MRRVRSGDESLSEAPLCAVFTAEPLRLQVGDGPGLARAQRQPFAAGLVDDLRTRRECIGSLTVWRRPA